jgi:hypothetical protein
MQDSTTERLPEALTRYQKPALMAGAAALAVSVLIGLFGSDSALQAYLWAYLFWIAFPLGCLGVVFVHHLTAGAWSFSILRVAEAATRTFWLMALLFIPILLSVNRLYPWTDLSRVHLPDIVENKQWVLNRPMFFGCTVLLFAVWILCARFTSDWSHRLDETGDAKYLRRLRLLGGPGAVIYVLTVTIMAFFWGMTLEPEWFSTIYGPLYMAGQALTAVAFGVLTLALLRHRDPIKQHDNIEYFHHLGNLLLGFTVFWAYISFSQYLVIYSANLPEEVPWYIHRTHTSWVVIAVFLMLFHFAVPFFVLLMRRSKRMVKSLCLIAFWILVVRMVDLAWIIIPAFHHHGLGSVPVLVFAMMPVAWVGIGGLWYYFFIREFQAYPLLPERDPRMANAYAREGVNQHHEGHGPVHGEAAEHG